MLNSFEITITHVANGWTVQSAYRHRESSGFAPPPDPSHMQVARTPVQLCELITAWTKQEAKKP